MPMPMQYQFLILMLFNKKSLVSLMMKRSAMICHMMMILIYHPMMKERSSKKCQIALVTLHKLRNPLKNQVRLNFLSEIVAQM